MSEEQERKDGGGEDLPELDRELVQEFGDFLEACRRLESGKGGSEKPREELGAALRARILQRSRYRGSLQPDGWLERLDLFWVKLVTLLRLSRTARMVFGLALLAGFVALGFSPVKRLLGYGKEPSSLAKNLEPEGEVPPLDSPSMQALARLSRDRDRRYLQTWLSAENDLRRLRLLLDERGGGDLRNRLSRIGGADRRTRERIEHLSEQVARDLRSWEDVLEEGAGRFARVEALSLGLRALLAYGSTPVLGRHAADVRQALRKLEDMLPSLNGPALATALSAYMEAVLIDGGEERLKRLGAGLERFTQEQVYLLAQDRQAETRRREEMEAWLKDREERRRLLEPLWEELTELRKTRPEAQLADLPGFHELDPPLKTPLPPTWQAMNHWTCPLGALADAGLLLRVAPALGVSAVSAMEVRQALFSHLMERGKRPGATGASARAALLFAYPDLVNRNRDPIFASLRNYRLHPGIFDRNLRAVHYLAWGIFPVGKGWARTNQALRRFVANFEPQEPLDRAALLLTQLLYTAPSLESRSDELGGR